MSFVRKFSKSAIESLKDTPLLIKHLRNDCLNGCLRYPSATKSSFVFPAVRSGRIDFYWGGGKLFSYGKSGFTTYYKYASVMLKDKPDDNISESDLLSGKLRLIQDFCEGYERIKENCEKYSGIEALGVSSLYERFSCVGNQDSPVIMLDIEASFAKGDGMERDRIDIVALEKSSGKIRFIEAKHYSNNTSLRATSDDPAVIGQLSRYAKQLEEKLEIVLSAYKEHVHILNSIFLTNIPEPKIVDPKPCLLVFGFDKEQLDGYFEKKIKAPLIDKGLRVYGIGDIKKVKLETIFRGGKENW